MRTKAEYPKDIKNGSVVVKVYRVKHKTTASGHAFVVAWSTSEGRKTSQFASDSDALAEARLKADQLAAGRIEASDMSRSDRDELTAAREITGGVPLLAALVEWKKVREITSGNSIAAAEAWVARSGTSFEAITIESAIDLFLKAKKRAGVDITASYEKVFPSVKEKFGKRELSSLEVRELGGWLNERFAHPVTRNTVRRRIVTLFRWARKQGYLSRGAVTEAEQTDASREPERNIGVITAETFSALLVHFRKTHPEYLAALIVAGFCGLRRSEIHGQLWEDVDVERMLVRVSAAKRNTPARRLVPLCDAASAWLKICPDSKGGLCTNLAIDRIRDIGRGAGFTLPENCFRHSYISHRVAQTGNVAETALEAGNSPRVIFRHYRELFSKADGAAWFSIEKPAKRA